MDKKSAIYAKHMGARISPKKVKPVMDLVRGKSLNDAKVTLAFDQTKAAKLILKVLKSAEANARNNKSMDTANLYVSEIWAGPGPMTKWGRFVGRGHFSRILKRTSHIHVGLSERKQAKRKTRKTKSIRKNSSKSEKKATKKKGKK
jgi:large subunit ribosomal protein L22